jgi:hypothetical protein
MTVYSLQKGSFSGSQTCRWDEVKAHLQVIDPETTYDFLLEMNFIEDRVNSEFRYSGSVLKESKSMIVD